MYAIKQNIPDGTINRRRRPRIEKQLRGSLNSKVDDYNNACAMVQTDRAKR